MKRLLFILMICSVASLAAAALVDDFESYDIGNVVGQDPMPWVESGGAGRMNISGIEWDKYAWARDGYLNFTDDYAGFIVDAADTATTLFFRTMAATADENCAFGLNDTQGDGGWDNEYYIQWDNGDLQARDNSGGQAIVPDAQTGVWYNVWLVINNAANSYRVYVNTGTADATAGDEVFPTDGTWNPRGGTAGTLVSLQFEGDNFIGINDLHMWTGSVLTNPPKLAPPTPDEFTGILADYTDSIVNSHFAEPGTVKIWNDWGLIPGWSSDTNPVDSGVEPVTTPEGDGWRGFFRYDDPEVWQLTSTVITAGTVYEFSKVGDGSLNLSLYYLPGDDPNNARVILNSASNSVSAVVGAADPAVGRKLGVMLDNIGGGGWPNADYVTLTTPVHGAIIPSPADGATVSLSTSQLAWTPSNDPNFNGTQWLTYYVGTEPNIAGYLAVNSVNVGSAQSYAIPALSNDQFAMWRVDTELDLGSVDPNVFTGTTWSFETITATPSVSFDDNVATTLDLMPATLTATVSPADDTISAFTLLTDDVEYPDGATVSFSSDTTTDPAAPTYSLTTDTAGTYKVMLVVSKAGLDDIVAFAEIEVYADSCVAQQTRGTTNYNDYDVNADCLVNLDDFVAFAIEWLDDTGLAAPVTYDGPVEYIPEGSIIPLVNPSFELPGDGNKIIGFDLADGAYYDPNTLNLAEVPGWETDDPNMIAGYDSGVQQIPSSATDGTYIAFIRAEDPNVYQTISYTITGDEVFELSFDARRSYDAADISVTFYYLEMDGTTRTPLAASQSFTLSGTMASKVAELDLVTNPVSEAIDRPLGIEFDNVGVGWLELDNVLLRN